MTKKFSAHHGKFISSAPTLLQATKELLEINKATSKLYLFASLQAHQDISISANQITFSRVQNMLSDIGASTAFYNTELLSLD